MTPDDQLDLFSRRADWAGLSEAVRRQWFERFRNQRRGLARFCHELGIDSEGFRRAMVATVGRRVWRAAILEKRVNTASSGYRFEAHVRATLEARGYWVYRSHQSRGPADLIAENYHRSLYVQCKRHRGITAGEMRGLWRLAARKDRVPVMASALTAGIRWEQLLGPEGPWAPYEV